MWLFDSPKNYLEMVEKISKSVFFVTLFSLFFISGVDPSFETMLRKFSFGVEYSLTSDIKLNMAIFYIPLISGFAEHAFKIHDKLSDILRIRKRFDRNVIVLEYFNKLEIGTTKKELSEKYDDKKISEIMTDIFYKYVSSTDPKIDSHYIYLALGSWCWYWISLDTFFITLITGIIYLSMFWQCKSFFVFLSILGILKIVMTLLKIAAKNNAISEVHMILHFADKTDIEKYLK